MIVSLTPHTDMAPVPRVEIRLEESLLYDGGDSSTPGGDTLDGGDASASGSTVDGGTPTTLIVDVPEGTDSVTLWRVSEGRRMKVRGAIDRFFAGELGVLDLEAGRKGASSQYEIECFVDGELAGTRSLGAITLPTPGPLYQTVIQQPLNPFLSVVLEEFTASVPSITREAPGEVVYTEGSRYPTLISAGPRRGVTGVQLDFIAPSRELAAQMWATLGTDDNPQLPAWLIRSNHPLLPAVFFCEVLSLAEVDHNLYVGGSQSRFRATVTEIAPPAPGLVISPLSYPDLDVTFESYDDMDEAFPSYNARDTAWDLAGAAG